jgi:predicted metalloprotease with PDZ domain
LQVVNVWRGGPGELAGLLPGDVISEFDGVALSATDVATFVDKILQRPARGSKVAVKIYRDGKYVEKIVIIGLAPDFGSLLKGAGLPKKDTRAKNGASNAQEELMMPPGATIAPELLNSGQ